MKKLIIWFILFYIFSFSFVFANFEIQLDKFKNYKIQIQYNKIINTIIKKVNTIYLNLKEEDKQSISDKIKNISDNFYSLEKSVLNKDRLSANIYIENIKKYYRDIFDIVKNASILKLDSKKIDISYYADYFEWWYTANGNYFSQNYFSAAKCYTDFNTLSQIILDNKSIVVKVNDRPNCTKHPNLVDLSTIAFDFLAKRYTGKKPGEYLELWKVDKDYYKKYLSLDSFKDYWLILEENIPNIYFINEWISIKWSTILDSAEIKFSLTYPNWEKEYFYSKIDSYRQFYLYFLPKIEWKYLLKIENDLVNSSNFIEIFILDKRLFENKKLLDINSNWILTNLDIEKITLNQNNFWFKINIPWNDYNEVIISQENNNLKISSIWNVIIPENLIKDFNLSKEVKLSIISSKTDTWFSHDAYSFLKEIFVWNYVFIK